MISKSNSPRRFRPYPAYKPSGVDWLGEVPGGWEVIPLRGLAAPGYKNFVDGDWIESPFITDEGVRLIQTGNIGTGYYKEQGYRYITEGTFYAFKCTEVMPGDVLICRLADPVGRACSAPDLGCRMITSVDVCILKPGGGYSAEFIVYALSSTRYLGWLQAICRGGTRDRVSRSMLGSIRIAVPPPDEQRAIASFLDRETAKIDVLVAKKERLIELLEERRAALISRAVTRGLDADAPLKPSGVPWLGDIPEGWEVRRLTKTVESIIDYRGATPDKVDDGVFLVTAKNIKNGSIDYTLSQEYVKREEYKIVMRRGLPKTGDVLFTTEAPLAEVANVDNENIALAQRVIKIRGENGVLNNYFLKYWFMSKPFQFDVYSYATGSTAIGLKASKIGSLWALIPALSEQTAIAAFLDRETAKIDALVAKVREGIDKLKEYRTALISAAVTGKIDVRGYA